MLTELCEEQRAAVAGWTDLLSFEKVVRDAHPVVLVGCGVDILRPFSFGWIGKKRLLKHLCLKSIKCSISFWLAAVAFVLLAVATWWRACSRAKPVSLRSALRGTWVCHFGGGCNVE